MPDAAYRTGDYHPHLLFVSEAERLSFEHEVLPPYLRRSRWFGGKARETSTLSVSETVPLDDRAHWVFVDIDYADGGRETYQLLLAVVTQAETARHPEAVLAPGSKADRVLVDALYFGFAREALFKMMAAGGVRRGELGEVAGIPRAGLEAELAGGIPTSRLLKVEQSNSSLVYNERVFLKLYRKLEAGVNPDAELTRFLSERQGFGHVPPFIGALEYRTTDREPRVLGLAVGLVKNRGDAWAWALAQLRALYERSEGSADREFLARVRQLGARTGEMHRALARDATDPAFAPEPLTLADMREVADRIRAAARELPVLLAEKAPGPSSGSARQLASAIEGRAAQLAEGTVTGAKIRTHGDYHLAQVLETGDDFVILDFEGEPLRPLAYRRQKRSPLRDVAGMLRSFHYAAHAVLVGRADRAALEPRAEQWAEDANRAFLDSWLEVARGTAFLPATEAEIERLLDAFLLEKVIYEVSYELNNRPDWIAIPLLGLRRALRLA